MISFKKPVWSFVLTLSVFIIGISLNIEYSYLLFHIFAEFFSIIIAGVIFVITWNSRDKLDNGYLLFIGISFFFVGSIDLLHAIAYKGMNIFIGYDANLPTQMWIAARYLEAASLLIAPVMLTRRVDTRITLFVFVAVTSSLILLLFTNNFPDCYIEGLGLTSFKIASEYIICLILAASGFLLSKKKEYFQKEVLYLLYGSIVSIILAELAFTSYISVYGPANYLGHILKIIAFALIYRAIVVTGLEEPFELLFRNLSQSEKRYRALFENIKESIALFELIKKDGKVVDYRFIDVNDHYASMIKINRKDIVGKKGSEVFGYNSPPPNLKFYQSVMETGRPEDIYYFYEPSMKHYLVSAFLYDADQLATVISDITALKNSEEAVTRANRKLKLLNQITRHDINNQLTLLHLNLYLMNENGLNEENIPFYDMAVSASDKIESMIAFTKEYEEIGVKKPRWQSVTGLYHSVMKGCPSTDHIISCDIPKELEILADPLVVKVWYNLVENAIRYGKKPVTIRFSSTMDETDLVIIVEDDGPGISMDEKKKIFEFGYGQNTGMGLPLSREILSITDITIEETGVENSGARFEIRVPEGMYRMKRKE